MSEDLDPRYIEWRDRARDDFEFFCRGLSIRPKKDLLNEEGRVSTLAPFHFNPVQRELWRYILRCIEQRRPIEPVICKARQFGVSTFFCAFIFWNMWRSMHQRMAIVAHHDRTLQELLATVNLFYQSLPEGFRPQLRERKKDARVTKEGLNMVDRDCTCIIVPQSPDALRGPSFNMVLNTEVSSFKNPEDYFQGFVPTMSESWYRMNALESSPKDGFFREEYMRAKSHEGGREAFFFPWWAIPELYSLTIVRRGRGLYDPQTDERIRFDEDERREQKYLSREAAKLRKPPITDEQMYWRQRRIAQPGYDEERFNTEYPRDDVSCFEQATRSAFKSVLPLVRATVEAAEEECPEFTAGTLHSTNYDPVKTPDFNYDAIHVEFVEEPKPEYIDQERRPGLFVFKFPVPGYLYTVGADVADEGGGILYEDDDETSAFSVGSVYCCNTREQVASWRGHIDPHDFGDVLVLLGYWYNTAMLCIERNNMGISTEKRIMGLLHYPNTFRWPDFGSGGGKLTKKAMWETNARTKTLMISEFRTAVRDGLYIVRDPGLHHEMSGYIVKGGGFKAGPGYYADRIIAASLSWQSVEQTGYGMRAVLGSVKKAETNPAKMVVGRRAFAPVPERLPEAMAGDTMRVADSLAEEWGVPKEMLLG